MFHGISWDSGVYSLASSTAVLDLELRAHCDAVGQCCLTVWSCQAVLSYIAKLSNRFVLHYDAVRRCCLTMSAEILIDVVGILFVTLCLTTPS